MSDETIIPVGKAELKEIAAELSLPYASLTLKCDSYRVTLQNHMHKRRLETWVYVEGKFRGEWLSTDCEERRRFYRPVRSIPSRNYVAAMKKISGRKWKPKERIYFMPSWPSPLPLLRHLIKNNTTVHWVKRA